MENQSHFRTQVKAFKAERSQSRRYQCPYEGCDRCFTKSSNLTQHIRIHSGQRKKNVVVVVLEFLKSKCLFFADRRDALSLPYLWKEIQTKWQPHEASQVTRTRSSRKPKK